MNFPFTDLRTQYNDLKINIQSRINTVLEHGQYIMGPEVVELEERLANYTGSKHCITVASGTKALLITLMALDIKPGDEVITTPFTWISTVEVIALLGAKPIFVDIEADTANINANLIEEAITPRTKAIMPVSLFGQTSDMDMINSIAAQNGDLTVIEDAAQSFGAIYKGQSSCNISKIGCTSFFPSKPLGCYGDGGAIFTNDDLLAKSMREIRLHGKTDRYLHGRIGIDGRMDTLQCAIVLAKLDRFDWEVIQRNIIGQQYSKLILNANKNDLIEPLSIRSDRISVYAQYTILVKEREKIQKKLFNAGIPSAIYYPLPINEQLAYKNISNYNPTPVAKKLSGQVLSLPMSCDLNEDMQATIINEMLYKY